MSLRIDQYGMASVGIGPNDAVVVWEHRDAPACESKCSKCRWAGTFVNDLQAKAGLRCEVFQLLAREEGSRCGEHVPTAQLLDGDMLRLGERITTWQEHHEARVESLDVCDVVQIVVRWAHGQVYVAVAELLEQRPTHASSAVVPYLAQIKANVRVPLTVAGNRYSEEALEMNGVSRNRQHSASAVTQILGKLLKPFSGLHERLDPALQKAAGRSRRRASASAGFEQRHAKRLLKRCDIWAQSLVSDMQVCGRLTNASGGHDG